MERANTHTYMNTNHHHQQQIIREEHAWRKTHTNTHTHKHVTQRQDGWLVNIPNEHLQVTRKSCLRRSHDELVQKSDFLTAMNYRHKHVGQEQLVRNFRAKCEKIRNDHDWRGNISWRNHEEGRHQLRTFCSKIIVNKTLTPSKWQEIIYKRN